MPEADLHKDEERRLKSLRMLDILDTAHEEAYDDIAQLAAELCGTPIAAISLVDKNRQWFKANFGLKVRETPRAMAFCAHAIHSPREPLVVSDAREDPRFHDNPLVHNDPHIRFYAGVPLVTAEHDMPVGTLCVISNEVMNIDDRQLRTLSMLASHVERLLHLREAAQQLAQRDTLIDASNDAIVTWTNEDGILSWNSGAATTFGFDRDEVIGQPPWPLLQAPAAMQAAARDIAAGGDWTGEATVQTKSGDTIATSTRLQNIAVNSHQSVYLAICRDITSERQKDLEVMQAKRALDTAADAVMWLEGGTGRILYANEEACRRYQYSREEFLGLTIADIDPNMRNSQKADAIRKRARSQRTLVMETVHFAKDGSKIPVESASHLMEFGDSEFVCTTVRDITERKATQRRLQLTQRALDTAADAVIWAREATGEIVYANEAASKRYQYSQTEFRSMTVLELYTPAQSPEEAAALFKAATRHERHIFQATHVARDGTEIPVEIATHVLDVGEDVIRCAFIRDITRRRQTQQQLRLAQHSLDTATDGIFWLDADNGNIVYSNESACRRLQYTKNELQAMNIAQIARMVETPKKMQAVWNELQTQGHAEFQTSHVRKDGTEVPVEVSAHRVELGGATFHCGIARDITERLATQRQLEALTAEMQWVFDSLPIGVMTSDPEQTITRVNPAMCEMFGRSEQEMCGEKTKIFYANPEDFNKQGPIRDAVKTPTQNDPYDIEYRRKDGSTFICRCWATKLIDADGECVGQVALLDDVSERVATQEKLAKLSEDRREMLKLLGTSDGVWSWEVGTDNVEYAPGFRKMLGFEGDDYESFPDSMQAFQDRLHPEDADELWKRCELSQENHTPFSHEFRMRHANGTYIWVRERGNFIRTARGTPIRMAGITYDITQWKEAERERDQFFNAGVQLYGIADLADATWVKASDNWVDVLGYTTDELIGTNYVERAHPDDRPQFITNMKNLSEGTPLRGYLGRLRHKDGSYRWIEFNVSPPRPGRSHVYFTANDVTEQDHDVVRKIADAVPMTLYVFDIQLQETVFVNRHVATLLGYSAVEAVALGDRIMQEFIHPDDLPRMHQHFEAIGRGTDDQRFEIEYRLRSKDGSYRNTYSCSRVFRRDPNGAVKLVVGTTTPLDDLAVLRRYADDLETANEELERFAYVASHDLKQPLRGIENLASWIEDDVGESLPAIAREHLTKLKGRVTRMDRLLDDLLVYFRIGRIDTAAEEVDTEQLITDVAEFLAPPPDFRITCHGELPVLVTERIPLEHVFRNLIGNAIKHRRKEDGWARVSGRTAGSFHEFTVSDGGSGIAPEFHERIFGMFQTLRPRDEVEGSGMGLSLAKKHIEIRGGQIEVESEPGVGATFRFTWPTQPS